MKIFAAFLIGLFLTGPAFSQTAFSSFCLGGCPIGTPEENTHIRHHVLELSNNPETKFADWVAYKITPATLGSRCVRLWKTDPGLNPETTLRPLDYKGMSALLASDRGHQAPLASLCGSAYQQEANYLSNITPQKSALNQGAWVQLENAERRLIKDGMTKVVYSMTGPLYEREMPALPHAHLEHTVPSGYWKIVSIQLAGNIETVGFVMDQETPRDADFCAEKVTVNEIEERAHLDFFTKLPQAIEAALERGNAERDLFSALGCE